jgi:hypothetical protein
MLRAALNMILTTLIGAARALSQRRATPWLVRGARLPSVNLFTLPNKLFPITPGRET